MVVKMMPLPADMVRLQREYEAVFRVYGATVRRCAFGDAHPTFWDYYGVVTNILGWRVVGRYQPTHPCEAPRFWTDPQVRSRHLIQDGEGGKYLCLWHKDEWNRDWTMATALGVVHRFLGLVQRGKVD